MSSVNLPVENSNFAQEILNRPRSPLAPPASVLLPSPQSAVNSNRLDGATVTAKIPIGSYGVGDIPVILPKTCSKILIASIGGSQGQGDESYGLYLHFEPMLIDYVGAAYVNQGTENWIQLHDGEVQTDIYIEGTTIEFRNPIDRFLIDVVGSANTTWVATFVCADDICEIKWKPQPSTLG